MTTPPCIQDPFNGEHWMLHEKEGWIRHNIQPARTDQIAFLRDSGYEGPEPRTYQEAYDLILEYRKGTASWRS